MNTKLPPSESISLPQIMRRFPDEKSAIEYFESIRWFNGVVCPHCGNDAQEKFWKIEAKKENKIRHGLRQCAVCKKQFRVTLGTIFEDSHIPLNLWLIAWYLMCGAKKGMSAKQMQRHLGIGSYKTAWFMCHRIRHAMHDPIFEGKLTGDVEVDETYVGGKGKRSYNPKTLVLKTGYENKIGVVSMVERNGSKRSFVPDKLTAKNLREAVIEHVSTEARVHTDDSNFYPRLKDTHEHYSVNHSKKQYAVKLKSGVNVTTNTVESSFSLLKRGVMGSFHHISRKHLPLYLAEFDFRWNHRKTTDGERTVAGLRKAEGKRLTMKPLVKKQVD